MLLRVLPIAAALLVLAGLVLLPAAAVIAGAAADGSAAWWRAVTDPGALAAVRLTLLAAGVAVPVSAAFGIAAAWSLGRFRYPGQAIVLALVELPAGVPPVVAGLATVLLLGAAGPLAPAWRAAVPGGIGAVPGVLLATVLVTFPLVARELIPALQRRGTAAEEAALTLGASGLQVLTRVTLPGLRASAVSGAILCAARAVGELGAAAVVNRGLPGAAATLPVHVAELHRRHALRASLAVSSLLFAVALPALLGRRWARRLRAAPAPGGGR